MVSAMQTLVQVVNKHGCRHAAADSVTYEEGIACGEITNDKMRPFLVNISHDPNARHLIPKNPAEEERLYNTNAAYKKASDEHDEFSEAFQAVYPLRGGRENMPVYLSDADYAALNDVLNQVECPLLPPKPVYYEAAIRRVIGCMHKFPEGSETYKKLDDATNEVMRNVGLRMAEHATRYPTGGGIYNLEKVNAVLKEAGCEPVSKADDDDDIEQKIMDCIADFRDSPNYSKDIQDKLYAAMHGPHVAGRRGRIGTLKKGKLTDLGYHPSRKTTSRHRALSKAVKKYGKTSTLRKVNAVAVLTKRRAPLTSRKYRADVKYLQKRYF